MAKILVIEDTPISLMLTTLLLEKVGHTVLCAENAEIGLLLARSELPSLILMDIELPGMNGLAATRLLKQDPVTHAIPVVALTALAMKGDGQRMRDAGCDGYITKPLRYRAFWKAIAIYVAAIPTKQRVITSPCEGPL